MTIKLGTTLTLEPTFNEKKEKYRCKVVDIDNHTVYIDYPLDSKTNKTLFLIDGTQLRVTYAEESKAIFAFQYRSTG